MDRETNSLNPLRYPHLLAVFLGCPLLLNHSEVAPAAPPCSLLGTRESTGHTWTQGHLLAAQWAPCSSNTSSSLTQWWSFGLHPSPSLRFGKVPFAGKILMATEQNHPGQASPAALGGTALRLPVQPFSPQLSKGTRGVHCPVLRPVSAGSRSPKVQQAGDGREVVMPDQGGNKAMDAPCLQCCQLPPYPVAD